MQWIDGTAKCPYSPDANNTALVTSQGDYYIASTIDFSGRDHVIYRIMGKQPYLRTVRFDPKWLSGKLDVYYCLKDICSCFALKFFTLPYFLKPVL